MPSDRVNEYLKSVCAEVRWRQAHDAVREELAAHIEDQTEAYVRSGMERETAERKAVESMGSPAETGLRLDASYRPKPQWGPVIMLTALLMISAVCRFAEYGNGGDSAFGKFIIAVCIGGGLFIWLYNANLYRLAEWSRAAYLAAVLLCLVVYPLCHARGRSVAVAALQTAAIAMPALFAGWLYVCRGFGGLLTGGAMLVIPIAGMLMAPYTGAAVNVAAACLAVIAFASVWGLCGKNRWLPIALSWGSVLCGGYGLLRSNARWWQRVAVMLRPEAFPEDYSYQIRVIRDMLRTSRPIGRGQDTEMMRYSMFFKRDGSIDREAYVDFMLTTIAHRYGWVIALIIAVVLIGLIAMLFFKALKLTSLFGKIMGCGICASLLMQTVQYMLGNCGIVIMGWLPLPFLSYGNTSLVVNMAMMGLLCSLMRSDGLYADKEPKPLNKLRLRLEWEK